MPPKARWPKQITGEELGRLAKQMVEAKTAKEARKLQEQYIEGFAGENRELQSG